MDKVWAWINFHFSFLQDVKKEKKHVQDYQLKLMKASFRKPSTPNKLHRHKVTLDCSFTKGSIHTRTIQTSLSVELIHFIDMVSQEKKK